MTIDALARGLAVLSSFSPAKPEWGVTELSASLGIYKSRVHRILDTLAVEGFVERDALTLKYRLGWKVQNLSAAASTHSDSMLLAIARPYLLQLREQTKGAIHIRAIRDGANVIIDALESPLPLRLVRPIGERSPIHFGASGKAILAFAPDSVRDLAFGAGLDERFTGRTVVGRDAFLRELKKVRRVGFAFTDEEAIEGVRSVAAPVLSRDGYAAAAITSALPAAKLHDRSVAAHGRAVAECAALISRRLGALARHAGKTPPDNA